MVYCFTHESQGVHKKYCIVVYWRISGVFRLPWDPVKTRLVTVGLQ